MGAPEASAGSLRVRSLIRSRREPMPAERIAMRLVREVLRLITPEQLPVRETARRTGEAPSTVRATLGRLRAAGLSWPLPLDLTDAELEARLYGEAGTKQGHRRRAEPDWAALTPRAEAQARHACRSSGTSTSRPTRTAIATAASATSTAAGRRAFRSPCARPTWAATSCSWTTPATRCR